MREPFDIDALLAEIRACRACAAELAHEPRPVVRVSAATRLLISGQAPGRRVHESGLPFDDPSGDRLRGWMGVDRATFYGHPAIGVAAMAFCYPGTDPHGADYPPMPRCAQLWRRRIVSRPLAPVVPSKPSGTRCCPASTCMCGSATEM